MAWLAVGAVLLTGCASVPSSSPSPASTHTIRPAATASPTPIPLQIRDGFPAPATYWQACYWESQVCTPSDPSLPSPFAALPVALQRPFTPPTIQRGKPCPTTVGVPMTTPFFGQISAEGSGPVRSAGAIGDDGVVPVTPAGSGWYGFKTDWFSLPSYLGPWMIRGAQLDGTSPIIFGEQPTVSQLVVPPILTVNTVDGFREAPGGTYVRGPGCYAWQVDGLNFSYHIVFRAVIN